MAFVSTLPTFKHSTTSFLSELSHRTTTYRFYLTTTHLRRSFNMSAVKLTQGTTAQVRFSRVVDGDTIRIYPTADSEKDEPVRILCLDTEESYSAGSKPVTPWGREAKKEAERFFQGATEVTIEFPGNDSVSKALDRYRGNYGRLLVFVYRDGKDFQEHMIRNGYSPYFNKYGNAVFEAHHQRYTNAEREAQTEFIGVWDQLEVNGSIIRDYPKLTTWWTLRAKIIDEYRKLNNSATKVYNTRLDYEELEEIAQGGDQDLTIFTEVRNINRIRSNAALIGIGSKDRPFNIFLADTDTEEGKKVLSLLSNRYISDGESTPRRSYCYVSGPVNTYRGRPQMTVTSVEDIKDSL